MTIEYEVTKVVRAEIAAEDAERIRQIAAEDKLSLLEAYYSLKGKGANIEELNADTVDELSWELYSIDE